jgi:hypothetical protein
MSPFHKSYAARAGQLALMALGCGTEPGIPGPPALLVMIAAPSGWQQSGVPFARPPVIQLADADGNSVPQASVIVTATITSGAGTLSGVPEVATADTGMAIFEDLSITGPAGENTLTFSSPGLVGATSTFNLTAGIAGTILVHEGDNQVAASGMAVSTSPSVWVTDANQNPVSGVAVTFEVTSGGGSLTGAAPTTDALGIATVGSWTLGSTAGGHMKIESRRGRGWWISPPLGTHYCYDS